MIHGKSIVPELALRQETQTTSISVVIPVRNEEMFIGRTLEELLGQEYPPHLFNVYVVDGESTDRTCDIVREYVGRDSRVHLLYNPERWSSAARNKAIRSSDGEIVVVIDGHCQLNTNRYLASLVDAFQRSDADCIGRPQPLDISDGSTLQRAIAIARSSWLGHHPDSYIYSSRERFVPAHSVGVAYRRSVFEQVGYFDESFDACEDVEFNHRVDRAGLRCFLTPQVRLHYHPRNSLRGLFRQLARYGQGRVRLFRKHPKTFSLKSFLPAVFLMATVIGALAACFSQTVAMGYLGMMLAYGILVALFSLALSLRTRNLRLLFWLPVVFGTVHFGAGKGTLQELVFGNRSSQRNKSRTDSDY